MSIEHRQSERLETSYAISVRAAGVTAAAARVPAQMTNLSQGGLCFVIPHRFEHQQRIEIDFPALKPVATLTAQVVWCRPQRGEFSVGVEYVGMNATLRTRLVEMHRAIVEYQKIKNAEGYPAIDLQQAAAEWLSMYGEMFLAGQG